LASPGPADPEEIARRTGVRRARNVFRFPTLIRKRSWTWIRQRVFPGRGAEEEPVLFALPDVACFNLLSVEHRPGWAPQSVPLELTGPHLFPERGPHAIPSAPLEDRFGPRSGRFLEAGRRLGARKNGAQRRWQALPFGLSGLAVEVDSLAGG